MAEAYKFSGRSGMFFDSMYSSQSAKGALETAMARVRPCLFYFNGECTLNADTTTPCAGAKVNCDYYTGKFQYLTKEYVSDGKGILTEHILEIFKTYLDYDCSYSFVEKFATEEGISAYTGTDVDGLGKKVVLPRRTIINDSGTVESLPYHPPSLVYKDYINFVSDGYFKLLFPRPIFPLDVSDIIYQGSNVSVLLDVPGYGYTYVIYLSELSLAEKELKILEEFFKTGDTVLDGSSTFTLNYFFNKVFEKLREKEDSKLVVECVKIGFGVSLVELSSMYDLSECLIVYSESKLIFSEAMFELNNVFIGRMSVDSVTGIDFNMSYCDINLSSNSIYDLAVDHTLDVSYDNVEDPTSQPKVSAAYKGQDLAFGVSVDILSKRVAGKGDEDKNSISLTALPLPWYNFDDVTKKYLWSLSAEEKKYTVDIDYNLVEQSFELGKIIFFKNIIIIRVDDSTFPFYIKDCKFNSYTYKVKYQAYHPMLEYDINSSSSFFKSVDTTVVTFEEATAEVMPNQNREQSPEKEVEVSVETSIPLLESLPCGTVILVPDISEYSENFDSATLVLEFTFVKGNKIEYFPDTDACKDEDLFIPGKCENLEQFKLEDLAADETYNTITKVVLEEEEEEEAAEISLSNLIKEQKVYYVELTKDLEVDKGTGATYKQEDITEVSYFYFSYSSFNFLFDFLAGKYIDEGAELHPDPENSEIQKLLRGERPLLSTDDLGLLQGGSITQESYNFKYLYEKTVRSFINNRFYEIFPIELLIGKGSAGRGYTFYNIDSDSIFNMPGIASAEQCSWILPFSASVSDFYILKQLSDAREPKEPGAVDPPVEVNHNLTHISNTYRAFGLTTCRFSQSKLEFSSVLTEGVKDNFEAELNKIFYFYILGISKFVQDHLFLVKYKNSIIPIIKRIPVVVSQVGLPDPEVSYKWKSNCSIYTYLYDTGLNPFTKISDVNNLNFFINPFYIIVHKNFRDNKYQGTRTATNDYGFLFSTNWWVKYKQKLDNFGFVEGHTHKFNAFLDVYKTLAEIGDSVPTESDIIRGFSKGKDILYIEVESIDYVYSSYCGDHDFTLGSVTPYLYDRTADLGFTSGFNDPRSNKIFNFIYYTGDYDKNGVGMKRSRPYSRFVGPMWFPFRSCEVTKYSEFADYSGVRHLIDSQDNVYSRMLRGFSCTDLVFKPYAEQDIGLSDFKYLFIDDCFGSINPYRYSSSFYSIDSLNYYNSSGATSTEIAPTYLASNASVPWRVIPTFYNNKYMVLADPHRYTINAVADNTPVSIDNFEKYVTLDLSNYEDFDVGNTNLCICKEDQPSPGKIRSILYNCLIDTPPILPYNYNKDKYICGYERMRGGDAHFIYQCLYPYHHGYTYLNGCKCICDYENKGEESYGPIEDTLLPHVLPVTTDAGMTVLNSVFYPAMFARFYCGYILEHMPCPIPTNFTVAKDWLAGNNIPFVPIYSCTLGQCTEIADGNDQFWTNFDTLDCKTDGPTFMKACLNHYIFECTGKRKDRDGNFTIPWSKTYDYNGLMFVDKNTSCTEHFDVPKCESTSSFHVSVHTHSETNLTSRPLYYHFAADWAGTYDYTLLGASMQSRPSFYGDGALRVYETYDKLKETYTVFNKKFEVSSVDVLPMFGGVGKFFRMCYFSTCYGKVPFSTMSGTDTVAGDDDPSRDDNYVYKLSGYSNTDAAFVNDFEYGYLPEKSLVFKTDDINLFKSLTGFTEDDSIKFEIRECVRFEDLIRYEEAETIEKSYYKYKGNNVKIKTFGAEEEIKSGPAFVVIYDNKVLSKDKCNYYSKYGLRVNIAAPIFGDTKIVDPFPFGDSVTVFCMPLRYKDGYLNGDTVKFRILDINKTETIIDINVKENVSLGNPWKFCVETDVEVVNEKGQKEIKVEDSQLIYLCYDNFYNIGKLTERDTNNAMSLDSYDVICVGDSKYKINRGFYLDLSNTILPYSVGEQTCKLYNLNASTFSPVTGDDCFCEPAGLETSAYIKMLEDCFITNLEGSFFSSRKYNELAVVGYLCLETSEEYYAIGNLYALPEVDSASNKVSHAGKYHYNMTFSPYKNYNKVKYCGKKYRLVFTNVVFFCEGFNDTYVDVAYGRFTGGELGKVTFNKVSSLKAITYSEEIEEALVCDTSGVNLYYENLNDKLTEGEEEKSIFYAMPFGFVHKLKGGVTTDKQIAFKEGYNKEFEGRTQFFSYTEDEQRQLDRIDLPVERDIFDLIHYPTCFVRFCLKSNFKNVVLSAGLVPDLYSGFGYVPIKQWVAPGHRLDLYPDSLYAGYAPNPSFEHQLAKAFANTDCLDSYKNDLDALAKIRENDDNQCNYKKLLKSCGFDYDALSISCRTITPHNMCFITHVDHGMFGYPDITDVSGWLTDPCKVAVYNV